MSQFLRAIAEFATPALAGAAAPSSGRIERLPPDLQPGARAAKGAIVAIVAREALTLAHRRAEAALAVSIAGGLAATTLAALFAAPAFYAAFGCGRETAPAAEDEATAASESAKREQEMRALHHKDAAPAKGAPTTGHAPHPATSHSSHRHGPSRATTPDAGQAPSLGD